MLRKRRSHVIIPALQNTSVHADSEIKEEAAIRMRNAITPRRH